MAVLLVFFSLHANSSPTLFYSFSSFLGLAMPVVGCCNVSKIVSSLLSLISFRLAYNVSRKSCFVASSSGKP